MSTTQPEDDRRVRELLGALREDVHAPAELREAVMREVAAIRRPLGARLLSWWLKPRPIRVSPALASAGAMALAVVLFLAWPRQAPPGPGPETVAASTQIVTRFVLIAPEATSVRLTGDFAEWSPDGIELEDPRGTGVWTADVPLSPGVYQYTFIVDGTEWRADPTAISQVDDGFGRVNSVVIVPGTEA